MENLQKTILKKRVQQEGRKLEVCYVSARGILDSEEAGRITDGAARCRRTSSNADPC